MVIRDNNIRLFNKINRKHYKKNSVKRVDWIGEKRCVSYWFETDWIWFEIKSLETIVNNDSVKNALGRRIGDSLLKLIIEDNVFQYIDKVVEFNSPSKTITCKLISIMLSNRDAYYYCVDENNGNEEYMLIPIYHKIIS